MIACLRAVPTGHLSLQELITRMPVSKEKILAVLRLLLEHDTSHFRMEGEEVFYQST